VLALPPPMARALREIPGTEDYAAANTLLKPEETQRIALRQADMWSEYRNRQDFLSDKQENFNAGWFDGTIAPSVWRRNTQDVQSERGLVLNTLRGRAKNAKGEVVLIDPRAEYAEVPITPEESLAFRRRFNIASPLPLRHPVEELVEAYYSYTPLDIDGDGSPEWNQFFRVRAEFLNLLPDDVRDEVIDVIDRNVSEPERVLRELNRGFLGEYWEIDDKLAEVHGVSRLINEFALARKHGDEETLAAIRRDPRYKRYTREVSAAKESARMSNAQLDYALNIFGFTGETISFKNTTAKSWWASDNRRPNLGRFNTSREIATIGTSIGRAGTTGNADTGNRGIR